jgi:hypothetical protein
MFRAHLFAQNPFGIWNNYWYGGHHIVGYSLLFPAVSAALTPQLAAALAATGTAALFEPLARRHFGPDAWLGATVFAAATATNLFTGRLAFAFGVLPGLAAIVALDRKRPWLACLLALVTAPSSPVAALFVALAAAAYALTGLSSERRLTRALPGLATAVTALAPVAFFAVAFPEGGVEPFVFSAFWPIPLLAIGALAIVPQDKLTLRMGVALYALGTLASYLIPTAVGSNAARLGTWLAAPLAALLLWRKKVAWLALAALPLLYIGWHDPVRDLATASSDPSQQAGYYRPLISFLERQPGQPFRIEIPFTSFHWEAYAVASRFPIARGWERQLDVKDNHLFYGARLDARTYEAWLRSLAVRFVAVSSGSQDYSAKREIALIDRGLPYLRLVLRTAHWRVYEVRDPTPLADPPGAVTALGPNSVTLSAAAPGSFLVRVRFTPYWALSGLPGCVAPAGPFTRVRVRRPGTARLVISFALDRIAAHSRRCN